ncbi:MAG TPA: helix-hairpin-helix domain-containing protein [Candidatus Thermoplasmatota archaeon]|nr:helix-hairpin-helix domain-containing protein [Candidatus Thermoplasmatota archaeon]
MRPPPHPDRVRLLREHEQAARELRRLMNVGPATAGDLLLLEVRSVADLAARDPDELYERLCHIDGYRHDACVRDVLQAAVEQAQGKPPRPWFEITRERKLRERRRGRGL